MSAWISLVIFVEILIIIVPCFSITIDCHQAKDIHSFITSNPLLKSLFNTISIGNCQDFTLNLSKPLPMPISSLQLVNMTNLSLQLETKDGLYQVLVNNTILNTILDKNM